jgi:hypothetical protein
VNIKGNEKADKLAKQALDHTEVDNSIAFEAREVNEQINDFTTRKWQKHWDNCTTGKFNRELNKTVKHCIKYENSCRRKEVTITRLRVGRCRLNKYLYDIGVAWSNLCSTCKVPETIEHYLLFCKNSDTKDAIKSTCKKMNVPYEVTHVLNCNEIIDTFYPHITRAL